MRKRQEAYKKLDVNFNGNPPECLGKLLSSRLGEKEGGEGAKEGAEAENEEGEDGGELGKVDHHGGEEDGDAPSHLAEGQLQVS